MGREIKIGGLSNPYPSLKFHIRGFTSISTPGTAGGALIMASPCIASDYDSLVAISGNNLQSDSNAMAVAPSSVPAGVQLPLPTGFSVAQLSADNSQHRLISAELVINNITAALNRLGVFYVLCDYENTVPYAPTTTTYAQLVSYITNNQRTKRYVVADLEKNRDGHIRIPLLNSQMDEWRSCQNPSTYGYLFPLSVNASQDTLSPVAGYASAGYGVPNVYVYFAGGSQTLDMQMFTNWEVAFRGQEHLYTTSPNHPSACDDVTAHMQHIINTKDGVFKGDTIAREGMKPPPQTHKHAGNAWMFGEGARRTMRKARNSVKTAKRVARGVGSLVRVAAKAKGIKRAFNGAKGLSKLLPLLSIAA